MYDHLTLQVCIFKCVTITLAFVLCLQRALFDRLSTHNIFIPIMSLLYLDYIHLIRNSKSNHKSLQFNHKTDLQCMFFPCVLECLSCPCIETSKNVYIRSIYKKHKGALRYHLTIDRFLWGKYECLLIMPILTRYW